MLGHHDHRRDRILRRLGAAADGHRAVELRAGTQNRAGAELLEQRRDRVRRYDGGCLTLGRWFRTADADQLIGIGWLLPIGELEHGLRRRREDDGAAQFLAERRDLGFGFIGEIDGRPREHALRGRCPCQRIAEHREIARRRQLQAEFFQLPAATKLKRLETRVRQAPLVELRSHVVSGLLVRAAAGRPGADDVGDVVEGLQNFGPLGPLSPNPRDHRQVDAVLGGERDGAEKTRDQDGNGRQEGPAHRQPRSGNLESGRVILRARCRIRRDVCNVL